MGSLNVPGAVDIDRMRKLGSNDLSLPIEIISLANETYTRYGFAQVYTWPGGSIVDHAKGTGTSGREGNLAFNSAWQLPTGAAIAPRRFGVLACAYMGQPAL